MSLARGRSTVSEQKMQIFFCLQGRFTRQVRGPSCVVSARCVVAVVSATNATGILSDMGNPANPTPHCNAASAIAAGLLLEVAPLELAHHWQLVSPRTGAPAWAPGSAGQGLIRRSLRAARSRHTRCKSAPSARPSHRSEGRPRTRPALWRVSYRSPPTSRNASL